MEQPESAGAALPDRHRPSALAAGPVHRPVDLHRGREASPRCCDDIPARALRHAPGRHKDPRQTLHPGALLSGIRARPGLGRHQAHRPLVHHRENRPQDRVAGHAPADGFDHGRALGLVRARPEPAAATCRHAGANPTRGGAHRRELRAGAVHGAVHGRRRRKLARRHYRESGQADAIGEGGADPRHLWRRAGVCLAGRRHHADGGRDAHARAFFRLRADAGHRRADRIQPAPGSLRRPGRLHGARCDRGRCA